jgi:membrane protein implicated in regulation of membrane protease activity
MLDLGASLDLWLWLAPAVIVLVVVVLRYRSLARQGSRLPPGVGGTRLHGLTGVVTRPIDPSAPDAPGEVRVGSETWPAITSGPAVLPEGASVRILDVEGTRVRVEPTDERGPS